MEQLCIQKTEPELIRSWQNNPESKAARIAAAELLGRYQRRIYLWCFRYLKDHDQALDLAQDVLLMALQKIDSLKKEAHFSTWLFVMTRNCCLSEIRKRKVRNVSNIDVDHLPTKAPTPEVDFLDRLSEAQLLGTMESVLKKTEQEVVYLRCVEKMSIDSITQVMRIKGTSGARAVMQRARRKLKLALVDQGFNFGSVGGAK